LQESKDRASPELVCCPQEARNKRHLSKIDPAYIREVKQRGRTTACHCFIQKTTFQKENSAMTFFSKSA